MHSFLPPLPLVTWYFIAALCVVGWWLVRLTHGKSLVGWRWEWLVLRMCSLLLVIVIALGPTRIEEMPGVSKRPSLVYLFDGSQSMKLGGERSRWEESLEFQLNAQQKAGVAASGDTREFRFGHRLEPLNNISNSTSSSSQADAKGSAVKTIAERLKSLAPPESTDSRLVDALRQLSPQLDAKQSAGVVLFSDGRVRASEAVEQMAEYLGKSGIPIHVVPLGEVTGTGDVAIVSLVAENKVRKFTENQLTLFIRSFGMSGQSTTVRVLSGTKFTGAEPTILAEMPITLSGGAQSVTLVVRIDDRPEQLTVMVDPLPGELTERNNRIQTSMEIDRTKVRVLLVEGDSTAGAELARATDSSDALLSPFRSDVVKQLNIVDALQADEDMECSVAVDQGGGRLVRLRGSSTGATGFPKTRAELFAFDSVILSNFSPQLLSDDERAMLVAWIEGRGGSLILTGQNLVEDAFWTQASPLQNCLPVDPSSLAGLTNDKARLNPISAVHPIWRLRLEDSANQTLLSQMPALPVSIGALKPKNGADVLATIDASSSPSAVAGQPAIITQRVGRGRVLFSVAQLSGSALSELGLAWGTQPERVGAKFWRNLIYWITEGSSIGRRRLIAEADKRFYRPGEAISIRAVAYDETARRSNKYRLWAMVEPAALDDPSLHAPILWPEGVVRDSGELGPRVAWGEELPLPFVANSDGYALTLQLSETSSSGDAAMRIELTAYEGQEVQPGMHGTQVDSTTLSIQVLSDPFEQQNPLPNRQLLTRVAELSGGQVLQSPDQLAQLLRERKQEFGPPIRDLFPAWNHWWVWGLLLSLLSVEWIWRRLSGFA